MTQEQLQIELIKKVLAKKNYLFFENGNFNLNLIGIRTKGTTAGKYDDYMVAIYKNNSGEWVLYHWNITTDAGIHWLKNPMNRKGTALLVPNQYRSCWTIGMHQGKYKALTQFKPVKVYRDNNRDVILDYDKATIDEGMFGINIHRSNPNRESLINEKWSAGCQVFANPEDFSEFLLIIDESARRYGDKFTYTLITEDDFDGL
tara:strand:+ start:596 stop:1204 length:609 start_codon:yes stop_codon:yes gene_type:complete